MNLLLFTADDRVDDHSIRLTDRRLDHLQRVLTATEGDSLRVGEIDGQLGVGRVRQIDAHQATLSIELGELPPAKLPLCLVLALPRPKMLRRILRSVAELGVEELHLINAYRVEKSYWQTPVLQEDTIRRHLLEGLEQARDTVLPAVTCHQRFKPFVEDSLPAMICDRDALVAQPGDHPYCPRGTSAKTLLVVGPEGGLIPYEVDLLQAAGCQAVSLGPRILRVETAVTALIARLF